jgi:hypothetical protein
MGTHDRALLRPEDATSLEEFQARRVAELAQIHAMHSSWKSIGRILLSSLLASAAILFWVGVAGGTGSARWVLLVLAIACTGCSHGSSDGSSSGASVARGGTCSWTG